MPPKKDQKDSNEPTLLLGRMATNLKVGIVGVPNVGKSTFFNVLTKSQAAAENFPFCTIDPNENKYYYLLISDHILLLVLFLLFFYVEFQFRMNDSIFFVNIINRQGIV